MISLTQEDKKYLNSTPALLSLLYDLDLMPEQLREGTVNYARMMILMNWYRTTYKIFPSGQDRWIPGL